jgi:hypothetical protein
VARRPDGERSPVVHLVQNLDENDHPPRPRATSATTPGTATSRTTRCPPS